MSETTSWNPFVGAVVAILAAAMASCAPKAPAERTAAETEELLASTHHVWAAYFDGDRADLSYALPETDDVLLTAQCRRKSDSVSVTGFVGETPSERLQLSADGTSLDTAATSAWDEAVGGYYATAEPIGLSNPVLIALKRGHPISAGAFGPFPVTTPLEQREIDRFFAFCGR